MISRKSLESHTTHECLNNMNADEFLRSINELFWSGPPNQLLARRLDGSATWQRTWWPCSSRSSSAALFWWRRVGKMARLTAEPVRHPFELPPTRQPMVDVRVIRTRTSDRGLPNGTSSAFISHLPSHLSPSLLQELVSWGLSPSRS